MSRFQQQGAAEYDERISTLVPGYMALHQTGVALLASELPPDARILLIGAGTGTEIILLKKIFPRGLFTALDTSSDMLQLACEKCVGLDGIEFVTGEVKDLPEKSYDAALAILVMHFLPTHAEKSDLLQESAHRLKAHAPLLLCDLMVMSEIQHQALLCYALHQGLPEAWKEALSMRLKREFFPLTPKELLDLAEKNGLFVEEEYYRALGFSARLLRKKA